MKTKQMPSGRMIKNVLDSDTGMEATASLSDSSFATDDVTICPKCKGPTVLATASGNKVHYCQSCRVAQPSLL